MMFDWYFELPLMFKLAVDAVLAMIILMAIISGIYYLPKKNREMKAESLEQEREIAKKKVVINNQLKEYVDMVERNSKERAQHAKKIADLNEETDKLRETNSKLMEQNETLKKKVGGRPKKTS